MASSDISDESSDWEEIQYPYKEQHIELEPVTRDNLYDEGSSIFPPSEHEDLPVILEAPVSPPPSPALQAPVSDAVPPQEKHIKSDSKLWVGIYTTGKRVAALLGSCFQSHKYPSFVPAAAALAVAIFACVKILQWRNHLLALMREKDQRISQLLHQIAHMNEILSARRRVPVLRIN